MSIQSIRVVLGAAALAPLAAQPEPIALRLVPAGAHQAAVKSAKDTTTVRTKGTDPYVFCAPLAHDVDPDTHRVLAFEYSCPTGLDSFQVFYGPPIRAASVATGAALRATPAEQFRAYAIDLKAAGRGWQAQRLLRLDFGKRPGCAIRIRNLVLRPPNAAEHRALERRRVFHAAEERREREIARYLAQRFPAQLDTVQIDAASITIKGTTDHPATRVREIPVHHDLATSVPDATTWKLKREADGRFVLTLPRRTAGGRDRARSRFALTRGAQLQSHARYATLAERATARPAPRSIKGLGGISWRPDRMTDLTDLGIHNITVNLALPHLVRTTPSRATQPFAFEGQTFHIHQPTLRHHDKLLAFAAKHSMVVSGILLIPRRLADPGLRRAYVHPDAQAPGIYSMANLTSAEGERAFAAALTFLAQRYGAGRPARIHNWIVHNEVDAGWVWTNAGEKRLLPYVELYHRALRTTYACVRPLDPQARVFASLTHHFATTPNPRFYPGREVLEALARLTAAEGDFEWGVAYHPYPENLRDPRSWLDRKSKLHFDTPQITFRNIEVLDAFLRQPRFLYRGKTVRGVLLSEQGLDSRDGSPENLRLQAAGLAYAWLKIRPLACIEAFHYHRWIDHEHEDGLRLGLWTVVPGSITQPAEKKPAWDLHRRLGTAQEATSCSPFLKLYGVEKAGDLHHTAPIPQKK